MNDFSLKHDTLSGFEGLGSIPLLPLSVPTPHPTSTGHSPSLGPGQGGYCSVFLDIEICFTSPLLTMQVCIGTFI